MLFGYCNSTRLLQLPRRSNRVETFVDHVVDGARGVLHLRSPGFNFNILHGVRGVLRPGTMSLILGAPGSGKSAMLRALAGRHPTGGVEGKGTNAATSVTFNGRTPAQLHESEVRMARLAAYAPQEDVQEPLLTVSPRGAT